MSSRSGKSTPAKLVDSPDDIRRRRELAERKMRERHDVIKREHSDKIRKDLEDHARLQRELKEKEARELRRQQEIMQRNLERLNRDEERRKELLARNHAATSRTAAIRNVAFGSSTPRELSYLDRVPKSQKKLSPSPAREHDLKTPNKTPSSARRNLMVSSMYVPSPRSVKPSPKPLVPKTSNLMTQSVYATRTTSSAGYNRADRSTPTPKPRLPRTPQAGTPASGKPPVPSNLKFQKRVLDTNTKSEKTNTKSTTKQPSKLNEETPNGNIHKSLEVRKENVQPTQEPNIKVEEQSVEDFKSELVSEPDQVSESLTPQLEKPAVQQNEELISFAETAESVLPEGSKKDVDDVQPEVMETVNEEVQNLNGTSLEQELAALNFGEKEEVPSVQNLETEIANIVAVPPSVDEVIPEEDPTVLKEEENIVETNTVIPNVQEVSLEPIVDSHLSEKSEVPVVQDETPNLSLAQELGEDLFDPLNNPLSDNKPVVSISEKLSVEGSSTVAFNLNDTEYESMDTAPAEPNCFKPSSSEINVGNSSTEEHVPNVVDENNKDLTNNILDLEEVSKSPAEQSILSVANQAFDIVQTTNPTAFTPINEHAISVVSKNDTKPFNPENQVDSDNEMDISVNESSQEKPEILPEADQVKVSSLPPSPPMQQKSRENDDNTSEEPKKESTYKARIAELLSKSREQGPSPTERSTVVETAVPPPVIAPVAAPIAAFVAPSVTAPVATPLATLNFSPSTNAILQKLGKQKRDSGRVGDNFSNLLSKNGSETTLEDNPEDPRHERDLLN